MDETQETHNLKLPADYSGWNDKKRVVSHFSEKHA